MNPPPTSVEIGALLEHASWVRELAHALVRDPTRADDVVQETWLAAMQHLPSEPRGLRGWLATVLRRKARDAERGRKRREERERDAAEPEARPSSADLYERATLQRDVVSRVLELEPIYREVVLLRYFAGLPPREIARRLAIPVATVRTRLDRALAQLRGRLERKYGERGAWCVALGPLLRMPKAATGAGLGSVSIPVGVWIMTMNTKIAVAAVLALGVGPWWWFERAPATVPELAQTVDVANSTELAPVPRPARTDTSGAHAAEPAREPLVAAQASAPAAATPEVQLETVRGRLLDVEGRPLGGQRVVWKVPGPHVRTLLKAEGNSISFRLEPGPDILYRASTAADGSFELTRPHRPRSTVWEGGEWLGATWDVETPGWALVGHGMRLLGDESGASTRETVLVVAPAIQLAGDVVDSSGGPLAGVRLTLEHPIDGLPDFPFSLEASQAHDLHAQTGPSGRFDLPHVAGVPSARLEVAQPGHERTWVTVPARSTLDMRIVLRAVQDIPRQTIRGIVFDALGAPAPECTVRLGQDRVRTDEHGRFELSPTRCKPEHDLIALKQGFQPAILTRYGDQVTSAKEQGLDARLVLGPATLSIAGRVFDELGEPVGGLHVRLDNATAVDEYGRSAESVCGNWSDDGSRTDASGRFELPGLGARSYRLIVHDEELRNLCATEPMQAGLRDVEVRLPGDMGYADLHGRLVDGRGHGVARATVQLGSMPSNGPGWHLGRTTETDDQGAFDLERVPREGTVLCWTGYSVESLGTDLRLDAGEVHRDFRVRRLWRFRVELQDGDPADTLEVIDAAGARKRPSIPGKQSAERIEREADGFPVCEVNDDAAFLVLYQGQRELRRIPLELEPGELRVLKL